MNKNDVLRQIWRNFTRHHGFLWATSLTYTTLFALVPLLAVALSLFKAFGGFDDIQQNILLPIVSQLLDPTNKIKVMQYIQGWIDRINAGALGIIGTMVYILTFVPLFLGMENAINTIWGKVDDRPMWHKFVTYWAITTLGPVVIVLSVTMVSFCRDLLPGGLDLPQSLKPMMVVYFIFGLFLILKLVPNTEVATRPALIGAIAGGFAWLVANLGYQAYMGFATASFNIYGSLGAIPVFLLWIYINWIIVLAGVEISRFAQYPELDAVNGGSLPARQLKAGLNLMQVLYGGIRKGTYYSEAQLRQELTCPPDITATVIAALRQAQLLSQHGDLVLPSRGAADVPLADLVEIFFGILDPGLCTALAIDSQALHQLSLAEFEL